MLYLNDKRLVKQMLAGDERAFERFFDEYFCRLYRFALVRLADDPEAAREVAQMTLTKAIQKLDTYRAESQLFTWLCAICRNQTTDWLRKRRRMDEHVILAEDLPDVRAAVESFAAPTSNSPEQQYQRMQSLRLVQVALDQLPAHYGDVLEWKYIEGESVREIARRLAVGREAAQSTLARARRAFDDVYSSLLHGLEEHVEGRQ